jgi:catecholate siderophore receptor
VVKGPSGSDNGRGAPSGYINQSTRQPMLQDAIATTLAAGTDSRLRFEGDLNQALGAWDGAAVRLNLMYDQGDVPGRDVADNRRWGIAPSLALGLGSSTRAYFNYLFVKQVNTPDGGLPTLGLEGFTSPSTDPGVAAAMNAALPVDTGNFYGSRDDFEHVRANMFTARIEHDLAPGTVLRNTARYGRYTLRNTVTGIVNYDNLGGGVDPVTDASEWTISRSRQRRNEVNELLTNQINLTSTFVTGPVSHSLSTGAEFIHERLLSRGSAAVGMADPANIYNPDTSDSFQARVDTGASNDGKTLTGAIYVFDTLQFSARWSLNAGVRFDRYRTEYASVPAPAVPPATPAASTYLEDAGTLFTGKLGLVFKPRANGSIYAAVATSEQPPGGANFALNAGNPNATTGAVNINSPNLDPQEATNLEAGTKWDLFDNRLVVTAAAFDTRNKNDLATQDTVTGEITQYGETRVRGFELGASGMITPAWQLTAGLSSLDSKVLEGTTTGNSPTQGAQLRYTPDLTFTSWTTYRFAFGLTVGGGARYVDSQFRNSGAAQGAQTYLAVNPSYWLVDAMASYDVNESVSLQLNVQNLTDEFYLASVNNGGRRYILGTPRTVLLSGRVEF